MKMHRLESSDGCLVTWIILLAIPDFHAVVSHFHPFVNTQTHSMVQSMVTTLPWYHMYRQTTGTRNSHIASWTTNLHNQRNRNISP